MPLCHTNDVEYYTDISFGGCITIVRMHGWWQAALKLGADHNCRSL